MKSLKDELAKKGASIPVFTSLLEDYGKLWDIKNKLLKDIHDRGVVYEDVSSVGVPIQKNNPSTKELLNVNRQMLAILDKLDLNTKNCGNDLDDDEL